MAPELLLRVPAHSVAVDWWGLGILLYELLVGVPPFSDETPDKVFENILKAEPEYPEGEESLSKEAMAAVGALLKKKPEERAGLKEIQVL